MHQRIIIAGTAALFALGGVVIGQQGAVGPTGAIGPTGATGPDSWSQIITTFGGPGIFIAGALYVLKAFGKFLEEQRAAGLAADKQKSDLQTAVFNAQIAGLNSLAQSQKECVSGLQTASTTQLAVVSQCRELLRESQAHAETHKGP